MKQVTLRSLYTFTALLLFMTVFLHAREDDNSTHRHVSELIDSKGALKSDNDFSGSLAVTGYELRVGTDSSPRFKPAGAAKQDQILGAGDSNWSANFANAVNNDVFCLVLDGTLLYVGGKFTQADGSTANRIATYNGATWSTFGNGANTTVYSLAVDGSDLYIGGMFTSVDGVAANNIAKWNGSSWSALGSGTNGPVLAIGVVGYNVYAGGNFLQAGGNAANYIARWNGSEWQELGDEGGGTNGIVRAITISGGDIYIGGEFTWTWGASANHIVKYDGSTWSALGSGVNSTVRAIAVSSGYVYTGGAFTQAGGNSASRIARWDMSSSSWQALGSGVNATVRAIAVDGYHVYAGGDFTTAGGNPANHVARWNQFRWDALGTGTNDDVWGIGTNNNNVYVGGVFNLAGGKTSDHVAYWQEPATQIFVDTKVLIEGAYLSDGQMSTALSSELPLSSPYPQDPQTVTSLPANTVDWILLQLCATDSSTILGSQSGFLRNDGQVLDINGNTYFTFPGFPDDYYFIILKHRNHLAVMSADSVNLNGLSAVTYDFTTGGDKYIGTMGGKKLESGFWAMWAGDMDDNRKIDHLDYAVWKALAGPAASGYLYGDLNFDGMVNTLDHTLFYNNREEGPVSIIP